MISDFAHGVVTAYDDYLRTHFYFRDSELRSMFEAALKSEGVSKGPIEQRVPVFESGGDPATVLAATAGIPSGSAFAQVLCHSTPLLYKHQDEAIRRILQPRNVVVATGTGSGKTESFLYPILTHLFREHLAGTLTPGVRALIMYPMNALANDQRERLGELCHRLQKHVPDFRVTFGQYIGETPEDERDSWRGGQTAKHERLPGELVFRSEMRNSPPHILLTNYSMLEYMLLRPDDTPLFDTGAARTWRFIVLDEVHQYRGAKGIEMAMLLRRLRQRLREGGLPRGRELCCIATSATLAEAASERAAVAQFASNLFGERFHEDNIILPQEVNSAAGSTAKRLRGHLFLRVLEGAFLRFWPERAILLSRAPAAEQEGMGAAFELALCKECGQHYFVARPPIEPGRLLEPVRDPDDNRFGVAFLRPLGADDGEDQDDEERVWHLCLRCGQVDRVKPTCGHGHSTKVFEEVPPKEDKRRDELSQCGACGYSAGGRDPVRELVHGADGPNAVVATTLVRLAHPDRRKVLAFGDGRQSAAFFAWYLQDSYEDILNRNLILHAITNPSPRDDSGLTLSEIAKRLEPLLERIGLVAETAGAEERRRECWRRVYREFLTDERRLSLEGVGLVTWEFFWPSGLRIPEALTSADFGLLEAESKNLTRALLDTLRWDAAAELRTEQAVSLRWDDLGLQRPQQRTTCSRSRGRKYTFDWAGPKAKRTRLMSRILNERGMGRSEATEAAVSALKQIWDDLRDHDDNAEEPVLANASDARRLNPRWWRGRALSATDSIYRCQMCRRLHAVSIQGTCTGYKCRGTLARVQVGELHSERNHYRGLYRAVDLPAPIRVEEHTAQIDKAKARGFQQDFKQGKIHVLSCSTTFELGVDLGNLDLIHLRNVPPEPFNYVQRVGRAGRRDDQPGFAVTLCRRDQHDLYHFSNPERMIEGKTRAPTLNISNDRIVTRHLAAIALAAFFRAMPNRFGKVSAFLADMNNPRAVADFRAYVDANKSSLEGSMRAIVPAQMHETTGLHSGDWIDRIAGPDSSLRKAEMEVCADWRAARDFEEEAARRKKYSEASWGERRCNTIERDDVLSFLSRKVAIPKYGFPVDVVELDLQQDRKAEVALSRDLSIAIGEFAPGCEVVANKLLWRSYGLKRVPEKEWDERPYAYCREHGTFIFGAGRLLCGCTPKAGKYVVPIFGFVTARKGPEVPRRYRSQAYTTRPFFAGRMGAEPAPVRIPHGRGPLTIVPASPGRLVVLCEGRKGAGFYVCRACGFASSERKYPHDDLRGRPCGGQLENVALGHEIRTDVLVLRFETWVGPSQAEAALAVAHAMVPAAAELLEVPSTDLNAVVHGLHDRPDVILYDDVPGGAGLVARLQDPNVMRECLELARSRVGGHCGCDADTSCYGCLRSYRNRFLHEDLKRGAALAALTAIVLAW